MDLLPVGQGRGSDQKKGCKCGRGCKAGHGCLLVNISKAYETICMTNLLIGSTSGDDKASYRK
jgi:hypothetical protein